VRRLFLLLMLVLSLLATTATAEDGRVELVEKLGDRIPLDVQFTDSSGQPVKLAQLIDKPTIMVPVFYNCRNVCNLLLGGVAVALPEIKLTPGKDYEVISFSFDPSETPELAAKSKKTFMSAMQAPDFPREAWHYLTGTEENILALTDSAGYFFKETEDDFLHPLAIFVVSPDGTIVRYFVGSRPASIDLTMALIEAREGRIGTPIQAALQFCFSYDPEGRRYVFNPMRVSATVILLTLGSFLLFLILGGRKKKK